MNETATITLHLQNVEQLIRHSGFWKHRLTDEAEEFILEEAYKCSNSSDILFNLHLEDTRPGDSSKIAETIRDHFGRLKEKNERKLKQTLKVGWINLLLGSSLLGLLVLLVIFFGKQFPEGSFLTTIQEIFIILGWVIIWRPVETLLYDWRPFKREVILCNRLEKSKVEVLNE